MAVEFSHKYCGIQYSGLEPITIDSSSFSIIPLSFPSNHHAEAMAEALAVASAAVGLVSAASHGIRCLSKEINCMQAAPEYLANVRRELQSIENIIQSVQVSLRFEVDQDNWVSQKERIVSALQDCSKLCEGFYNEFPDLLKLDKLGIRDRARFAWAKDRVKALEADLNRCKATITLALSGAN